MWSRSSTSNFLSASVRNVSSASSPCPISSIFVRVSSSAFCSSFVSFVRIVCVSFSFSVIFGSAVSAESVSAAARDAACGFFDAFKTLRIFPSASVICSVAVFITLLI